MSFFCTARTVGTHFLVRTCVDRLAGNGAHTIADEMKEVRIKGLHRLAVRDDKGNMSEAVLEIKYCRIHVLPPIGKQKRYPALDLTVIYAQEHGAPKGRKRIDWKLITDLSVRSAKDAVEKLNWYAMRWKIEMFHKILKSGCKGRGLQAQNRRTRGEFDLRLLHSELACVLDDNDEPFSAGSAANTSADRHGSLPSRSSRDGRRQEPLSCKDALPLPNQDCSPRRLSCARQRSAAGQHDHVERPVSPDRHRVRRYNRAENCG